MKQASTKHVNTLTKPIVVVVGSNLVLVQLLLVNENNLVTRLTFYQPLGSHLMNVLRTCVKV